MRYDRSQTRYPEPVPELIDFEALPVWMKDNPHIHHGYRPELRTHTRCLRSVWRYFHNESINIWTHLGGALLFVYLWYSTHAGVLAGHPFAHHLWFAVFFVCSCICFTCSAYFHTFYCCSEVMNVQACAMDFVGIVCMISGSTAPILNFLYECQPQLMTGLLAVCFASGAACLYGTIRCAAAAVGGAGSVRGASRVLIPRWPQPQGPAPPVAVARPYPHV